MRAIKNKLIVKVQLEAEKSESGIIVDTEKKPDRGVVTSIGKEVRARCITQYNGCYCSNLTSYTSCNIRQQEKDQ